MPESFMTTEGDRSGTVTPSKDQKAVNKLRATIERLRVIESEWPRTTALRRAIAISEVRHDLASAVTILLGGEGET
jgi:hypothetical protein